MKASSILISDTNDVFRTGLATIFRNAPHFKNVCTARNQREIIALLTNLTFDFLCLDIDIPKLNSQKLIVDIKKKSPLTKIILFSSFFNQGHLRMLLSLGANSFLIKSAPTEEILLVVQELKNKEKYLSSGGQNLLLEDIMKRREIDINSDTLTRELLFLISHELTIKEISNCLRLSEKAIEYHRTNLIKNTASRNMVGLAIYAYRSNIYFDVNLIEKFKDKLRFQNAGLKI